MSADIDVVSGCFGQSEIERYGVGAGVVPVARAPTGEYHLLLGRERYMPSWKGSCRWSGFEGSRKPGESLLHTASREYAEESVGVLHAAGRDAGCEAPRDIQRVLACDEYWIRIVIKILNERRAERYHATYVVPVPWDEGTSQRFLQCRLAIEQFDYASQEWNYARPATLTGHVGEVSHDAGGERVDVQIAADDAGDRVVTFAGAEARGVLYWDRLRTRIENMLCHKPVPPGVRVTRDARWGRLQEVCVCKDFLEKDQVRWWSATQLRSALHARGLHGSERFRPYFLPVLQVILDELQRDAPPEPPAT